MRILLQFATAGALALIPNASFAHAYKLGSLTIEHPWARAMARGATVGGAYLTITNTGSKPERLTGITSPAAVQVELRGSTTGGSTAPMSPLASVEVGPGDTVEFEPGGIYVVFIKPEKSWKEGDEIPAVLTFEDGGNIDVMFEILGIGARPSQHDKDP